MSGNDANALTDYEHDGYVNLLDYSFGGSPLVSDSASIQPVIQSIAGNLRLTTIIRTNDAALAVVAETTTSLGNPTSWTTSGVTPVSNVNHTIYMQKEDKAT